jgi:flagellar operon protein
VLDPTLTSGVQPTGPAAPAGTPATTPKAAPANGPAFGDVLADKLRSAPLQFSGHARQRMAARGIDLDPQQLARLDGGVGRAAAKGGRDALVMVDDTAFVVSVPNRTVITAVDREHMREQVFTNIDSAVIA